MYAHKITGPEGVELRLMDMPPADEGVGAFLSVITPLLVTKDPETKRGIRRNNPVDSYVFDLALHFARPEDMDYAISLMAKEQFGLISPSFADAILRAPYSENAYPLHIRDPNVSAQDLERDARALKTCWLPDESNVRR